MSSTNRGQKGGGDAEFFPTPKWPVTRALERLSLPGGRWVEAGAGEGNIIRAVNAFRSDVKWTAIELREECRAPLIQTGANVIIEPFQRAAPRLIEAGERFDVAMFNPPFSEAVQFVLLCLQLCDWVVCLQRTQWIGDAEERHAAFCKNLPQDYRIGRIDFNGLGGDSTPYSWFVWPPGLRGRSFAEYELLPLTPSTEKKEPIILPPPRQGRLFD